MDKVMIVDKKWTRKAIRQLLENPSPPIIGRVGPFSVADIGDDFFLLVPDNRQNSVSKDAEKD